MSAPLRALARAGARPNPLCGFRVSTFFPSPEFPPLTRGNPPTHPALPARGLPRGPLPGPPPRRPIHGLTHRAG